MDKAIPPGTLKYFWDNVDTNGPNGCWLWIRAKNVQGYGLAIRSGWRMLSHRLAWELFRWPIPEGLFVCHNCPGGDNPSCCNPAHLWLGTQRENQRDASKKGMSAAQKHGPGWRQGEDNGRARLTADDVRDIRQFFVEGCRQKDIAGWFGVKEDTVQQIVSRRRWSHVA